MPSSYSHFVDTWANSDCSHQHSYLCSKSIRILRRLLIYPVSMLFADLLSLHLITFLMFFILVHLVFFSCRFNQKQSSSLHVMHKNMLLLLGATLHLRPDPSTLEVEDRLKTHVCKYQLCLLGGFQQMHLSLLKSQLLWTGVCSINVQLTEIHGSTST